MIIELKTAKITLEVSKDIAEKVDPAELAELITASGIMEAANAAGVDPAAAIDAVLNTPDAFDALLAGAGLDAFADVLGAMGDQGLDLGFGTGLPDGGPDFGDGTGLPGRNGQDWQDDGSDGGTKRGPIDLFKEQREKDEADATQKGEATGDDVFDTARDMSGGIVYGRGSGEIIDLGWSEDDETSGTVGTTNGSTGGTTNGSTGGATNGPTGGATNGPTGGATNGPTGGTTKPGDAGNPDNGTDPDGGEGGTGEGNEGGTGEGNEGGSGGTSPDDAPETGEGDNKVNGSGTDGTTTPGDDGGELPDYFDFGAKDDDDDAPDTGLGHTTQPGLLVEGGIGLVGTVHEPGYGLTQPAHDDYQAAVTFNPDAVDPTYGLTQPDLADADMFIF